MRIHPLWKEVDRNIPHMFLQADDFSESVDLDALLNYEKYIIEHVVKYG